MQVQRAVVAAFVTGHFIPPIRLDVIKHMVTPRSSVLFRCPDKDCQEGASCLGNRLVLQSRASDSWGTGYASTSVTLHIVHGKNDRRPCRDAYRINFPLPRGKCTKLLIRHITEGFRILNKETVEDPPRTREFLFSPKSNVPFSDSTFCQYWKRVMLSTARPFGLAYFPPTKARTIFVEEYVRVHGTEPAMWDGASIIMGNSAEQWFKSYMPSHKRTLARMAVARFGEYAQGVREVEGQEEGQEEGQMEG